MNARHIPAIYYAVFLIVAGLSSAYLFWQNNDLSNTLKLARDQCEQRVLVLQNILDEEGAKLGLPAISKQTRIANNKDKNVKKANSSARKESELVEEKPRLQSFSETLEDIVKSKYRFLLARLQLSDAEIAQLIELLMQREDIYLKIRDAEEYSDELNVSTADIADLRYELGQIDDQIQQLIGDEDIAQRFMLLKESDQEQEEFTQYTLGVNGLFPLSRDQQEIVLFSRLRHKQKFEKTIAETGFDMDYPLTYAQQQELIAKVNFAAFKYKEAYLDEVRPSLGFDDTPMNQYRLLENYTNTEFDELQDSLRKEIEDRGVMDPYK